MKRLFAYMTAACLLLWTTGCQPEEQELQSDIPLSVGVAEGIPVKSSLGKNNTEVANLSLALYADGELCREYYFAEMGNLSLTSVPLSKTYTVYALANVNRISFPASELDVPAMAVNWSQVGERTGWPMGFKGSLTTREGVALAISLVRLVARVDLAVDASGLSLNTFTATRIALKSGAGDCRPFVDRSVPRTRVAEPDVASASDLAAVNAGSATSYYLFESCFGDLLPGNSNPWNKVPASLGTGVNPPYVEVTGVLTVTDNSGTTRPVTYRFYLGQNATSNFDVFRNTVNTVTLVLTDSNLDRGSWKVEAGPFNERASLSFNTSAYQLPWLTIGQVGLRKTPGNLIVRVYEKNGSMTDAGLSFQLSGSQVFITSTRDSATTGTLYAGTPDGRLECACSIQTVEPPVTITEIRLTCNNRYNAMDGVYEAYETCEFGFSVEVVYSDGSVVTDLTSREEVDWVISNRDVVSPWLDTGFDMLGMIPGNATVYLKSGDIVSNALDLRVLPATFSVNAITNPVPCGGSSTLWAIFCDHEANYSTEWEIVEGAEYGEIVRRVYHTFVSNGSNDTEVEVVIRGTYKGFTATCVIRVEAPNFLLSL